MSDASQAADKASQEPAADAIERAMTAPARLLVLLGELTLAQLKVANAEGAVMGQREMSAKITELDAVLKEMKGIAAGEIVST